MSERRISHEFPVKQLEQLANHSLKLWDIPKSASAGLINLSENSTYLVKAPGEFRSILRIHRENYHSRNAIMCELAWSAALNDEGGIATPAFFTGINGEAIQTAKLEQMARPRFIVMFEFVKGVHPDESDDLVAPFEELGEIAALTHNHSITWKKPENFERLIWNTETVFGPSATWGDWRDGPKVGGSERDILEPLEKVIVERLDDFGRGPERYGLIHGDMRLANLLIHNGSTRLIDFDDCGLGWFLYDYAAAISFMEDHPQVPDLKKAWLRGYRKVRTLTTSDEAAIDTLVMFRRMALLAWIGSHSKVEFAQELALDFAKNTVVLAKDYRARFG